MTTTGTRNKLGITVAKDGSVQESVRVPDFSGVGRCRCQQPAVVVAVEMWEPAFGAGFQARWDGQQSSAKIPR